MSYALIINGDSAQREEITTRLSEADVLFRAAESEHEAVLMLQEEMPLLIVWDWPVQDIPPEIFLAVLRQEGFCGTVLVCAPTLDVDDIPFDLLLQKPYEIDLLTSTVGRLLVEEARPHGYRFRGVPGA
jgi:hypothetical protein